MVRGSRALVRTSALVRLAAVLALAGCSEDPPWWDSFDVVSLDAVDGSGLDFEVVDDFDAPDDGDERDARPDDDVPTDADADGDLRADTADVDGDAAPDGGPCVDNACGGCDPLPLLGGPCGPCGLDVLVCDGIDALTCSGRTTCEGSPPAAPEWVDASDAAYVGFVRLSWAVVADATGYRVYRDGVWLESVGAAAASYDDPTAPAGGVPGAVSGVAAESGSEGVWLRWDAAAPTAGATVAYAVAAVGPGGESDRSPADEGSRGAVAVSRYEVSVNGGGWVAAGPDAVATSLLLDEAWIGAPRIVPGTVVASTTDPAGVTLSAEDFAADEPVARARVRAVSDAGEGAPSDEVQGRWFAESLNYAWSRAAAADGPFGAASWFGASAYDTTAVGLPAQYYQLRVSSGALVPLVMPAVVGLAPPPPGVPRTTASTDREDDVRVTWTVVDAAVGYELQIDGGAWQPVTGTSYTDTAASAGTLRGCTPAASDGTFADRVTLDCGGAAALPGAARSYRVRSVGAFGTGAASAAATGHRAAGTLRYAWERSAGDTATGFASWVGAPAAASGADTAAAFNEPRYYRVTLSAAASVAQLTTSSDRGYRGARPTVVTSAASAITSDGATLNGRVTDLGGAAATTDVGFCWRAGTTTGCAGSSSASPCGGAFTRVALGGGAGVGDFARALGGLSADTAVAFCAYATNAVGVAHGAAQTFRTLPFVGCGDGVRAAGEDCDGSDFGATDCAALGLGDGRLTCTDACTIDASDCLPLVLAELGEACTRNEACTSGLCALDVTAEYQRCVPRELPDAVGGAMEFRYVPATPTGGFTQGSPDTEVGREDDEAQWQATITRPYFVARTEVTQGQWKEATGGVNPSCFQGSSGTGCSVAPGSGSPPVETVDWWSSAAYANWLSEQAGLERCYVFSPLNWDRTVANWADGLGVGGTAATGVTWTSGHDCVGYRLLTETEWEWAARGPVAEGSLETTYFWGDAADGAYAWFSVNAGSRTRPVGGVAPNAYGLRDMSGNVWEWVWDVYAGYPSEPRTDYASAASGAERVRRGGAWDGAAARIRSAERRTQGAGGPTKFIGLRLARTAPCGIDGDCGTATGDTPADACVAGTQNRRGCDGARTVSRLAAGGPSGTTIIDNTCSAVDDWDDSTTCWDANSDHTYRIYMRAGESLALRYDTLDSCDGFDWYGTLKVIETAEGDATACDAKVYCDYNETSQSTTYVALRDGWVIVVADGSSVFDDRGTYRLTLTLSCRDGFCGCG